MLGYQPDPEDIEIEQYIQGLADEGIERAKAARAARRRREGVQHEDRDAPDAVDAAKQVCDAAEHAVIQKLLDQLGQGE